ncbi:hypothetical protein SH467x_001106 [Pirellulaceae bacterium SH467]|jgi:hypothetical protein
MKSHRSRRPFDSAPVERSYRNRRRIRLAKLWCNYLFAAVGIGIGSPAWAQQNVIHWPRLDFVIPFQIDSNGQSPQEVLLEVSEDGGQNWSMCSRGDTRTRQFQYRAARDGTYIFRLKSIDSAGRRFINPGEPLRIAVDTSKPNASLIIDIDPRGEMLAEFLASDSALDAANISLEYQTESTGRWVPISFQLNQSTTPGEVSGYGTWSLPDNAKQLVVRLIAKDLAGNATEVTRLPQLPKTAVHGLGMQLASQPKGLAPQPSTDIVLNPVPRRVPSTGLPVRELTDSELESIRGGDATMLANTKNSQSLLAREPSPFPGESIGHEANSRSPGATTPNANPASVPSLPTLGAPQSPARKPLEQEPLYANTRAFSLDYRIENDPGAPITEVELWGTIDEGRTWEVWGLDPDRTSPFDIEVENDGLFGFRMVIVGANGLASNRPRPGDKADTWILVDTVPPQSRLASALYGTGKEVGSLVIEYRAQDEYLGERPISLFYAESPTGPWQVISRGIRNQGRFVWPSNPNLPPTIYLKMETVDLAGNITSSTLDIPIQVEGIAPRGRIQGFRPLARPGN